MSKDPNFTTNALPDEEVVIDRHIRREYNARLALQAVGLNLERNHQDHWTRREFGCGYHIRRGGQIIEGVGETEYEMTLEQVENYINHIGQ
jgi:hypothetical protein